MKRGCYWIGPIIQLGLKKCTRVDRKKWKSVDCPVSTTYTTMKLFTTALTLFSSLLILSGAVLSGCGAKGRPRITWNDLSEANSLPVTVEGTLQRSYMTGDSCYYSEWAYGAMHSDGSADLIPANQSHDSITIVTPRGIMRLDIFEIRTYLGAYYSRTFNPENQGAAPTPIQKLLERVPETIAVREYLLQPERTYYVRVRSDSAMSPPKNPGDQPQVMYRNILEISDMPFREGIYARELTPAYK